jgi:hypothetical protein
MHQAKYVYQPDDQNNRDQSVQNAPDGGLHRDEVVDQPHQDSDDDQRDDNLDQWHTGSPAALAPPAWIANDPAGG